MLLTEEQAKEKWCPYKYRMSYGAPANEDPECFAEYVTEQTAAHPCIASACMAWRWTPKRSLVFGDWRDENDELQGEAREQTNYEGDEPRGYCGAFGRPDNG